MGVMIETAQSEIDRSKWYVLAVLFLAAVISYTDRLILNVLVEPLKLSLRLSDTQISLLQGAAFAVIYSLAALPLGRLADLTHRRNLLIAGIVLWTAGTVLCGVAHSFYELFGARLLVGFGEAGLFPAGTSLLLAYFPARQRATAIGIFFMGSALGSGAAVLVGGLLLELFAARPAIFGLEALQPWRCVLVSLAVPGIALAGLFMTVREPERERAAQALSRPGLSAGLDSLWHRRSIVGVLLVALMFQAIADYGSGAWLPSLLVRRFELLPAQGAVRLGPVILAAAIIGPTAGGFLADFLQSHRQSGRKPLVTAMALFAGIPLSYLCFASSAWLAILLFGALTLVMGIGVVAAVACIQDVIADSARGTAIALQSFLTTIVGLGCGPTAVALINDSRIGAASGIGTSIACVIVPCLFFGGATAWLVRARYQRALGEAFPA